MALLVWSDKFDVGVNLFNEQHKHLVDQINKLHQAMVEGKGRLVVKEILIEVLDYTKYHFEEEEAIFKKYNYPETESHAKEHNLLLDQAIQLREKAEGFSFTLSSEVMDLLNSWISNHILGMDMAYKDFFKTQNLDL